MLGIGINVLTRTTEDVGHWGVVTVFVIAVGGTGCIGAYFVRPVWEGYGIPQAPASALEAAGFAAPARAFTDGGGAVSVTAAFPWMTAAANVPVMPVSVNRLEKVVRVPPAVAVDRRPKKLPVMSAIDQKQSS
jgi:hypothetical protein